MILIADSGSTKTDWWLADHGEVKCRIQTAGCNPFFQTAEEMQAELTARLLPALQGAVPDSIHFYGAGCTPEKSVSVSQTLAGSLAVTGEIEVCSDMLGAARSLCGHGPGIACILGTGSNSCFYDGTRIVSNVSPLGFILGDEGSGAVLGKLLVGDLLKNQLSTPLKEEFFSHFRLTQAEIIDRVYRRPFPNRFLASLSPFLAAHIGEASIRQLVLDSFTAFLKRNIMQYPWTKHDIHFIGSIAYHYRELLHEAARQCGLRIGTIRQSPMEGLVRYHYTTVRPSV